MLGRLVHKADFERLLAARSRIRSTHFAVHHVDSSPSLPVKPIKRRLTDELSTGQALLVPLPVDDLPAGALWLGCVVPKRYAKRAVTRSLLKRLMRSAVEHRAAQLPAGLWLLRLTAGFAAGQFVSARSPTLRRAAHAELEGLLGRVIPPSRGLGSAL